MLQTSAQLEGLENSSKFEASTLPDDHDCYETHQTYAVQWNFRSCLCTVRSTQQFRDFVSARFRLTRLGFHLTLMQNVTKH